MLKEYFCHFPGNKSSIFGSKGFEETIVAVPYKVFDVVSET